jgi:hypothetical protein
MLNVAVRCTYNDFPSPTFFQCMIKSESNPDRALMSFHIWILTKTKWIWNADVNNQIIGKRGIPEAEFMNVPFR